MTREAGTTTRMGNIERSARERRAWWTAVRDSCPEARALGEAMLRVVDEDEDALRQQLEGAVGERDRYKAALDFIADGNASLVRDALLKADLDTRTATGGQ